MYVFMSICAVALIVLGSNVIQTITKLMACFYFDA